MKRRRNARMRSACVLMSIALAIGLMPSAAFASQLAAGEVGQPAAKVATQANAKVKTVYVITSVKNLQSKTTHKYSYNAKGLVAKRTEATGGRKETMSYDKNGFLKTQTYTCSKNKAEDVVTRFTRNGKGLPTKSVRAMPNDSVKTTYTTTYTLRSGKVINTSTKLTYTGGTAMASKFRYTYLADGKVSTKSNTFEASKRKTVYKYDAKGNLARQTVSTTAGSSDVISDVSYKNTYKNGRVTKQLITSSAFGGSAKFTFTFAYKAVKVPASYASKVEQQQWSIVNRNVNNAFDYSAFDQL